MTYKTLIMQNEQLKAREGGMRYVKKENMRTLGLAGHPMG